MALIALPILVFASFFLHFLGAKRFAEREFADWRTGFLSAALCWGVLILALSEGLSLLGALSRPWVTLLWSLSLSASIIFGLHTDTFRRALTKLEMSRLSMNYLDRLLVLGFLFIAAVLAVVAMVSVPSNTDSLLYHMARVAHWIQNADLNHYPTSYRHQLWTPPFAEIAMLNLHLLTESPAPTNLVQWFSMAGSLVGVSLIGSLMGLSLRGQLLAVSFTISVPMGILQATSTQNDYVAVFWFVILTYFVVLAMKRSLSRLEVIFLATAVGLGMMTKNTFYVYMVPLLAWYFVSLLKRAGFSTTATTGVLVAGIVLLLNFGIWTRNIISFGGPLGPQELVSENAGIRLDPGSFASALSIGIAQNLPTPILGINSALMDGLEALHGAIGEDLGDYQLAWAWNHEDLAGSPVHLLLIGLSAGVVFFATRRSGDKTIRHFTLVTFAIYLLIPLTIVESINPFSIRYQLPFFILGGIVFSTSIMRSKLERVSGHIAILLTLTSLPWVFLNNTRPIIAMRTGPEPLAVPCTDTLGCTRISSIFRSPEEDALLANMSPLKDPIASAVEVIKDSGCRNVGLRIDSHDPEYPFWWLLDAPGTDLRIETIYTFRELERYIDPSFRPCAIICTICNDRDMVHGLDRITSFGDISIYGGSNYSDEFDG